MDTQYDHGATRVTFFHPTQDTLRVIMTDGANGEETTFTAALGIDESEHLARLLAQVWQRAYVFGVKAGKREVRTDMRAALGLPLDA
jgi:hypothetical protein